MLVLSELLANSGQQLRSIPDIRGRVSTWHPEQPAGLLDIMAGSLVRLFVLLSFVAPAFSSMYCGDENCYDVLKVGFKATDSEIKKAYRKLSLEVHPDKNRSPDAPAKFQRIATAYEILADEESRADYDYALAHPEERMYNQYRYYSHYYKKTVQADVRLVIGGALLIFSAIQYGARLTSYNTAMKYIKATPRYQYRLKQLRAEAEAEAMAAAGQGKKAGKGKGKGKAAAPISIDEKELEKKIDVNVSGGYSKPKIEEILVVRLLLLPIHLSQYLYKRWSWVYKYWIKREPYDREAQILLTCQRLDIPLALWDSQPEKIRERILQHQIWIPENYSKFMREWKNSK